MFIERFFESIRQKKLNAVVRKYNKKDIKPYNDVGFNIIANPIYNNGISRAHRYEIDRIKSEGLYNPKSRNVLILGQPTQLRHLLKNQTSEFEHTYRIGLWVTEYSEIPTDWRFALNLVHEIWTPSKFSARAFQNLDIPVKVVPHAVRVCPSKPLSRARFGIRNSVFLWMTIMDLTALPFRKNPFGHIEAWQKAFCDKSDVRLILKIRFNQKNINLKKQIYKMVKLTKNIQIIEEEFNDEDMAAFQDMGDVYLSLHRAEGYGLNIHEMLELGKPVIATGWSGNMEFMLKYKNVYPVPYSHIYFHEQEHLKFKTRQQWAEPDLEAAVVLMINLYNDWKKDEDARIYIKG